MSNWLRVNDLDGGRLRAYICVFFLALALPAGFLVWQTYSQLKWEAFHQYRVMAEELTGRMDARLTQLLVNAEARAFADYSFLVVSGDANVNILQRSPLAAFPVSAEIPGLIGYFQIDAEGAFSTPLLPVVSADAKNYGISINEFEQRSKLATQIRKVLGENQLVKSRLGNNFAIEDKNGNDNDNDNASAATVSAPNKQQAFDQLYESRKRETRAASTAEKSSLAPASIMAKDNTLGRVADLKLDGDYEKRSTKFEAKQLTKFDERPLLDTTSRVKRREQILLPEQVDQQAEGREEEVGARQALRINTFQSEIEPLEFSLLDSGHVVFYRKVWRGGERFIQGMLVERAAFIEASVEQSFRATVLSNMSDLIVAYQGNVLHTSIGKSYLSYAKNAQSLDGALLYRNRLSAPFDSLELIYTINRLPPGPGLAVLGWVSLVLALVLCGGVYGLYRLGLSQIKLVRSQQDFVSAVSHELKTPLTSIRMYGEMLKNGWAPEEKKQRYYEFIHDESERLTRLISNVLQLANMSHNEASVEMKPMVVADLISALDLKIKSQVESAEFELDIECDADAQQRVILVDQDYLTQIIINLVDNAIKFSRNASRQRIEIRVRNSEVSDVVFAVRDFGPGIPKDQMRAIFDMFFRVERELTRETVGTGIGLAIVHQLVVAMGGKIDVLNRDPGTEFLVTLPGNGPING